MSLRQPPKFTRHESTSQERLNERKAEEKQIQRLLAILAKKMGSAHNTSARAA
jgi:hypothetical protein